MITAAEEYIVGADQHKLRSGRAVQSEGVDTDQHELVSGGVVWKVRVVRRVRMWILTNMSW